MCKDSPSLNSSSVGSVLTILERTSRSRRFEALSLSPTCTCTFRTLFLIGARDYSL
jgi:hypothetical protein